MTNPTADIPDFIGTDEQLVTALKHMLTRDNLTAADKSVIKGVIDLIGELEEHIWEVDGHD